MATKYQKLYWAWGNMMKRCYNQAGKDYKNYGGRGITISQEWHTPSNFIKDMEGTYQHGLSLERIDNSKDYSKENCRWATHKEQNNNTRKNRYITFNGITQSLSLWAEKLGIKRTTLDMRIREYNWPIEKALTKGVIL